MVLSVPHRRPAAVTPVRNVPALPCAARSKTPGTQNPAKLSNLLKCKPTVLPQACVSPGRTPAPHAAQLSETTAMSGSASRVAHQRIPVLVPSSGPPRPSSESKRIAETDRLRRVVKMFSAGREADATTHIPAQKKIATVKRWQENDPPAQREILDRRHGWLSRAVGIGHGYDRFPPLLDFLPLSACTPVHPIIGPQVSPGQREKHADTTLLSPSLTVSMPLGTHVPTRPESYQPIPLSASTFVATSSSTKDTLRRDQSGNST